VSGSLPRVLAFNSTVYDWLKLVHVLAAIVWVGGGIFVQIYATKLLREQQPVRLAAFARDIGSLGQKVFMPAALTVVLMGVVIVIYAPFINFTDLWIALGLLGAISTFITGAVFIGPESQRLGAIAQERGPEDPEVQQRIGRIFKISRIDQAVIVLVVVDMVLKPGR
jgi:uncharacterized membrane protein